MTQLPTWLRMRPRPLLHASYRLLSEKLSMVLISPSTSLHILHASGQKFLCGRPKTHNYEVPPSESVYGFPVFFPCQKAREAGQGP